MIADETPRETDPSADISSWRPPRAVCFVVNGGRAGGGVLVAPDLVLTAYRTVADLIDDQTPATTHCFFGSIVGAKGYERTRDREVATIVASEKQIGINRNAPTPTVDGCALLRLRENKETASDAVAPAPISPHSPRPEPGEVVFVASRYDKWSPMRVSELADGGFALERAPDDPVAPDGEGGVCFTRDGAVIGLVAEYYTPLPKESVYVVAADALYEALVGAAPGVEALLERAAPDAPTEQSAPEPEPAAPRENLFIRLRRALQPALRRASVIAVVALVLALPYLTALLIRAGANAQSDHDSLLARAEGSPPDTVTTLLWSEASELFVGTREGGAYRFVWTRSEFEKLHEAERPGGSRRPVRDIVAGRGGLDFVRRGAELAAGLGNGAVAIAEKAPAVIEQDPFGKAFPPGKGGIPLSNGQHLKQGVPARHLLRLQDSNTFITLPAEMGEPADVVTAGDAIFVIGSSGGIEESVRSRAKDGDVLRRGKSLRLGSPVVALTKIPGLVAFASSQGAFRLEPGITSQPPAFPVKSYGTIAQIALARASKDILLLALTRDGDLFFYRLASSQVDWKRLSVARLASAARRFQLPGAPGRLTAVTLDPGGQYGAFADELGLVYVIALDEEVGNPDKSPRLVAVIRGHAGPVTQLSVSPNRQWLASASLDGRLRVTHLPTAIREADWPLHDLLAPAPPRPLTPRPLDAPASIARNPAEQIDDSRDRIIVFGADRDLAAARVEIERARAAGFVDVEILLRQGWYRSVAHFPSDEARNAALLKLRALLPSAADAYARRVSDWCDAIEPTGTTDMIRCRLDSDGGGALSDVLLENRAVKNLQRPLNAQSGADLQPAESPRPVQPVPNPMRKRLK